MLITARSTELKICPLNVNLVIIFPWRVVLLSSFLFFSVALFGDDGRDGGVSRGVSGDDFFVLGKSNYTTIRINKAILDLIKISNRPRNLRCRPRYLWQRAFPKKEPVLYNPLSSRLDLPTTNLSAISVRISTAICADRQICLALSGPGILSPFTRSLPGFCALRFSFFPSPGIKGKTPL